VKVVLLHISNEYDCCVGDCTISVYWYIYEIVYTYRALARQVSVLLCTIA